MRRLHSLRTETAAKCESMDRLKNTTNHCFLFPKQRLQPREGFLLSLYRITFVHQDLPSPPGYLRVPQPSCQEPVYQDFLSPPRYLCTYAQIPRLPSPAPNNSGFPVAAWVPKGTSAQLPRPCISGFPVAAQVPMYLGPGT